MNLEIEATFLEVDKNEIRSKLKALGGKLIQPEILMRRIVFDLHSNHAFARVRDEGNRIVLTYKNHHNDTLTGTEEINVEVNNYEDTIAILKACGLRAKYDEDSYRETWELDDVEITIDTWPWIPTYIEIEGPSEISVKSAATKLGYNMQNAVIGSVDSVYKLYYDVSSELINEQLSEFKFVDAPTELASKLRSVPLAPAKIPANPHAQS